MAPSKKRACSFSQETGFNQTDCLQRKQSLQVLPDIGVCIQTSKVITFLCILIKTIIDFKPIKYHLFASLQLLQK
jgi:hypothetical protein